MSQDEATTTALWARKEPLIEAGGDEIDNSDGVQPLEGEVYGLPQALWLEASVRRREHAHVGGEAVVGLHEANREQAVEPRVCRSLYELDHSLLGLPAT